MIESTTLRNEEDYDRVTAVLFPFSGMQQIPKDILSKAAERGTLVHEACDAYINGMPYLSLPDRYRGYMESFEGWYNFHAKETQLYIHPPRLFCDIHKITGKVDVIAVRQNKNILIDFKTSAIEGKTWALQGSAYAYLCKNHGITIHEIEFVKLSKDGLTPAVIHYENEFDQFLQCLQVYRRFFKSDKDDFDDSSI